MNASSVNMKEQIARIICRDDLLASIKESVGSLELAYSTESMERAYQNEMATLGKDYVLDLILNKIVDRSWGDYIETAQSIQELMK